MDMLMEIIHQEIPINMREEPLIDFNPWPLAIILFFGIGVWLGIQVCKEQYDMPEEFNIHTISRDRSKPTEMMVIYDTAKNKITFTLLK